MTDQAPRVPVAVIAGALFCVVLVYLALQVRAGEDPAVGGGATSAAPPARQVIVRRVIVRRIVEVDGPRGAAASSATGGRPTAAPAPGLASPPAAASTSGAARQPVAAPAPPAPVVSRAS